MPVCQPTCLHERLAEQGFDEQRERGKRSFSSLLILQSWLNWYSIGLENRHPERVSGFGLRSTSVGAKQTFPGRLAPLALRFRWLPSLKVRTSAFQAEDAEFKSRGGH